MDNTEKWQAEQWRNVVKFIYETSGEKITSARDLIQIMIIMAVQARGNAQIVKASPSPNSLS